MTEFEIYLLTRLDYLQGFLLTVSILLFCGLAGWWFYYFMEHEWIEDLKKPKTTYHVYAFVLLFMSLMIPTKNEAIIIFAGGKAFDYIEKDKNLQKLPFQATEIFSKYLDKKITELDSVSKKK